MARLWSSGFELQKFDTLVSGTATEWDGTAGSAGTVTVSTTTVRSGNASMKVAVTTGNNVGYVFKRFYSSNNVGTLYSRFYIYIASSPNTISSVASGGNSDVVIAVYGDTADSGWAEITIDANNVIRVYQDGSTRTVIGTSSALTANAWHRIEFAYGVTASYVEAKVDGVSIGSSSSVAGLSGVAELILGIDLYGEVCNATIYFDDVAVNDTSGAYQNTWPGDGNIVHLKPIGTGDSNGFLTGVGGVAGTANNYTRVNEVTPDDATSYNGSAVLNAEDLFECENPTMGANDTINVVSVGVRMADLISADATASFKVELEKKPSGIKSQSSTLIPNSTTWRTNSPSRPYNYPLVTYQDPEGDNWTYAALESMQIGYVQSATNVQTIAVSTIWALVEYTPKTGATRIGNYGKYLTVGDGMSRSEVAN